MPADKDNPRTSRSIYSSDDNISSNSNNTNFPDDVWMDERDRPDSFLGKIFEEKKERIDDVFNVVSNPAMLETEVWKTQMAIYDELIAASVAEREEKKKVFVFFASSLLKSIFSEHEQTY